MEVSVIASHWHHRPAAHFSRRSIACATRGPTRALILRSCGRMLVRQSRCREHDRCIEPQLSHRSLTGSVESSSSRLGERTGRELRIDSRTARRCSDVQLIIARGSVDEWDSARTPWRQRAGNLAPDSSARRTVVNGFRDRVSASPATASSGAIDDDLPVAGVGRITIDQRVAARLLYCRR